METLKFKFSFSTSIQESFDQCLLEVQKLSDLPNSSELIELLGNYTKELDTAYNKDKRSLPFENTLAAKLIEKCKEISNSYESLTKDEKLFAVATINYLVLEYDGVPDSDPFNGFDDDRQVVEIAYENFVEKNEK